MTVSKRIEFCKVVICGFLSTYGCIWSVSTEAMFCLFELYSRYLFDFIGNPLIYVLLIDPKDENPYDYWNSLEKNQRRIWML